MIACKYSLSSLYIANEHLSPHKKALFLILQDKANNPQLPVEKKVIRAEMVPPF
jgi:hypothetical protein